MSKNKKKKDSFGDSFQDNRIHIRSGNSEDLKVKLNVEKIGRDGKRKEKKDSSSGFRIRQQDPVREIPGFGKRAEEGEAEKEEKEPSESGFVDELALKEKGAFSGNGLSEEMRREQEEWWIPDRKGTGRPEPYRPERVQRLQRKRHRASGAREEERLNLRTSAGISAEEREQIRRLDQDEIRRRALKRKAETEGTGSGRQTAYRGKTVSARLRDGSGKSLSERISGGKTRSASERIRGSSGSFNAGRFRGNGASGRYQGQDGAGGRERILLSDVRAYQKQEGGRYRKMSYLWILLLVWIGIFLLSLFFIMSYRRGFFTIAIWMENVSNNIQSFFALLTGHGADNAVGKTLCQYLCIAITGAGLSACGAVFQGTFRNVLAGPSTMGVMSGGTLGCTLYLAAMGSGAGTAAVVTTGNAALAASQHISFWQRYQMSFVILIGCFGAVALVLGVSTIAGKGKISPSALIVAGTVLSTVIGNVNMLIQYFIVQKNPSDPRIDTIRDLMMGSFNNATTPAVVAMMGIPIGICLAVLIAVSGRLNLLSFGEDEAQAMGLNVSRYRNIMILVGTVITAVVVAFCGHIGFLGFMVPLVARRIAGPDMRRLVPASMLTGAILLTLIFDVARFLTLTDSLNIITSPIGAALMIIVLLKKKGAKSYAAVQASGPADMAGR